MIRRPRAAAALAGALGLTLALALSVLATVATPSRAGLPGTLSGLVEGTVASHHNALWHVVHGLCLRTMHAAGQPAPCTVVDETRGYAVLKDVGGATQFLLVPLRRIVGIEGPELQAPGAPNYWQAAWESRGLVEKALGRPLPRDGVGLAVNSVYGRTQNQLHIHIDCVQPSVQRLLHTHAGEIGQHWSTLRTVLRGRRYRALWIAGDELGRNDPFKRLAGGDPAARRDMAGETLVVIGAVRGHARPGFIVLARRADPAHDDGGAGEELLDHRCRAP